MWPTFMTNAFSWFMLSWAHRSVCDSCKFPVATTPPLMEFLSVALFAVDGKFRIDVCLSVLFCVEILYFEDKFVRIFK